MDTKQKRPSPLHTDVSTLPAELRALLEQLLIEGATFEDTVEAINERGGDRVTLKAVESFFRSNLPLQQQRIRRQLKTAQALKKALGNPRSGQAQIADAVLLTGLMRVTRHGSQFSFQDAMDEGYKRENLELKQQLVRLRSQKLSLERRIAFARIRTELAKWKVAQVKFWEFKRSLESDGSERKLGPETLQKIQEIYGLISQPIQSTPPPA
jgi:hypothetical protein